MSDLYDLNRLHDTGPAPRGLDDRQEDPFLSALGALGGPAGDDFRRALKANRGDPGFASWGPWEWDEPVRVPEFTDRPEPAQEWGVLIGMWGLGLAAGLCVVGVVWQMVTGGRW